MKAIHSLVLIAVLCSFVSAQNITPDYFGMHWLQPSTGFAPLPFGQERLWDTHTGWADIETSPGTYKWSALDRRISDARAHGVALIYTIGKTPVFYSTNPSDGSCHYGAGVCWPPTDVSSGNVHFKNFLNALRQHVGSGIKYYEGWNEPNNKPFWSGTIAQLVQMQKDLYQTMKPSGAIILMPPSFSSFIPSMLNAGMGQWSDINTFHGKTCSPESLIPTVNTIKNEYAAANLGSRPLWNTEGGWGKSVDCSGSVLQVQAVARLYLLHWSLGVSRYYWYAYDNSAWGQLGNGSTLNPEGVAYREVATWMTGVSAQCSSNSNVWTCNFSNQTRAVWTTGATVSYSIPPGYAHSRNLAGQVSSVSGSVQIDGSPILLEK